MSLLSLLETIGQRIEAPFKTAADTVEGFFASLGADIQKEEQKILNEIEQDFIKDAGPLIQGISSFFTISSAEKIISNPLGISMGNNLENKYKGIVASIDSIVLQAPKNLDINERIANWENGNGQSSEAATLTITPTLSVDSSTGDNGNFNSTQFAGSLPSIEDNSLTGGFDFNLNFTSRFVLNIGLDLNIDIPGNGTYEFPSFGLNAWSKKKNLGSFQGSDGIASISAGIGYGGSITNKTNDSINLDLGISFLCIPNVGINPQIFEKFKLDEADIKNFFQRIWKGDIFSKKFWDESPIVPTYIANSGGNIDASIKHTFKATKNDQPVGIDALTGLEVDLNINPQVTGSLGLIFKEEDTGITLTALNFPLTLANKISVGIDENDKVQLTDAISLDAGLNIQALGASLYDAVSLPGFVWDIGSISEPLGTVNLLRHPEGLRLGSPGFEPSGVLTFDGIELTSANF